MNIIFLMGPTASGKTPLAIQLAQNLPCDIVSVDSAMVYRGMDIGTAKPTPELLQIAPHRLIDICDPSKAYSAGQFRTDALREIEAITSQKKIPLLVGGTMLYFRVLMQGIATLPPANANIREAIKARAAQIGWPSLHDELARIDPIASSRIHPNDSQRIQRALEVYELTQKPISTWQAEATYPLSSYRVHCIALAPNARETLHARIAERFDQMLECGFLDEVEVLYKRGDLSTDLPSIRSVGYREAWAYLAGEITYEQMREQATASTRQLAKRQLTWLRSWPDLTWYDSESPQLLDKVIHALP